MTAPRLCAPKRPVDAAPGEEAELHELLLHRLDGSRSKAHARRGQRVGGRVRRQRERKHSQNDSSRPGSTGRWSRCPDFHTARSMIGRTAPIFQSFRIYRVRA